MKRFITLFILAMPCLLLSQDEIFPELDGEELEAEVVNAYKPRTVLKYAPAREYMYETLQHTQDTIEGIYTGFKIYLPPGEPSRSWTYNNGINAEHIYPRSKGAKEEYGNGFSDLHHLKPTKSNVNSSRLNHPFREIDDVKVKKWFRGKNAITAIPNDDIDEYSELDSFVTSSDFIIGEFEPRESKKGDIARSVFYFFTMYNDDALQSDPDYFEEMRQDLCQWHVMDPTDSDELRFTNLIADVQDGKANPFVLDCSLALRMYCTDLELKCTSNQTVANTNLDLSDDIKIFPNPSNGFINIHSKTIYLALLSIYNSQGQLVHHKKLDNTLSFTWQQELEAGLYNILLVDTDGHSYSQRLIVLQ